MTRRLERRNVPPALAGRWSLALLLAGALAGCGVETATTAATGAAIKKQEVEQGKKTLEQSQQKIEQAAQQMQQRAEQGAAATDQQ